MGALRIYFNAVKSRFITHTPFAVSHLITSSCNCTCKTCDLWKKSPGRKNDMTKEEIFSMLDDAKKAGVGIYAVWGGEPLMRKDLPEILRHAKKLGLVTALVTNGFFLKDRCAEIVPYIDHLVVSIDSNDSLHDRMRGVKGIRERAIEGIKMCKARKKNVIINCVISRLNLGSIDGLLELSRELGTSITFEPMQVSMDYNVNSGYNTHLKPTAGETRKVFSRIIEAKKSGYRVGNSFGYLKNFSVEKKYVCHAPKVLITVDAGGNAFSCMGQKWGSIKSRRFKDIFRSAEYADFCKKAEKCSVCDISCVVETSIGYSMNPLFFFEKERSFFS